MSMITPIEAMVAIIITCPVVFDNSSSNLFYDAKSIELTSCLAKSSSSYQKSEVMRVLNLKINPRDEDERESLECQEGLDAFCWTSSGIIYGHINLSIGIDYQVKRHDGMISLERQLVCMWWLHEMI